MIPKEVKRTIKQIVLAPDGYSLKYNQNPVFFNKVVGFALVEEHDTELIYPLVAEYGGLEMITQNDIELCFNGMSLESEED